MAATLVIGLFFFSAVQLIFTGILGEVYSGFIHTPTGAEASRDRKKEGSTSIRSLLSPKIRQPALSDTSPKRGSGTRPSATSFWPPFLTSLLSSSVHYMGDPRHRHGPSTITNAFSLPQAARVQNQGKLPEGVPALLSRVLRALPGSGSSPSLICIEVFKDELLPHPGPSDLSHRGHQLLLGHKHISFRSRQVPPGV